jgi:hypothetical protein
MNDVGYTVNSTSILLNSNKIKNNAEFAAVLFHELRHAWQYNSGLFGYWYSKKFNNIETARNFAERDAYWFQINIGAGYLYGGYDGYKEYYNLTKNAVNTAIPSNFLKTWGGN